ncbi:ADP-ribose pyrophosphatase [Escherichia coli]|uniref:ADP-ribose pyrophosphatase n=1 Tax=Escherichia coli TaxID=562 RepID=A0A484YXN5_ECOLX|nr:ADP-ribose pyrophosphatase [Escherichia coli]
MLKPDNLPVTFGKNDVEIIARETLYRGFFSLDLYRFRSSSIQRANES